MAQETNPYDNGPPAFNGGGGAYDDLGAKVGQAAVSYAAKNPEVAANVGKAGVQYLANNPDKIKPAMQLAAGNYDGGSANEGHGEYDAPEPNHGSHAIIDRGGAYDQTQQEADPELGQGGRMKPPPPPGGPPSQAAGTAPPPLSEPGYFARIPVKITYVTILCACWMITAAVLNMIFSAPALSDFIIDVYFIFFGLAFLAIMVPNVKCIGCGWMAKGRMGVEKWAMFMSTHWGRGWFLVFISFLSFGMDSALRIILGICLILTGFLTVWCGRLAAAKYNRMREYLSAGLEGDRMIENIQQKAAKAFDRNGCLTEQGVRDLIEESGRSVTQSEVHAIYCFFDRDRDGKVAIKEFADRVASHHKLKSL